MTGPLLVPVQLQALLVNPNVRAQGFQRWSMDYSALAAFGSPEPAPFAGLDAGWAASPANDGVHVQWTLPAALRRGVHNAATGTTDYPLVPNRWLVVRLSSPAAPPNPPRRPAQAWIVESDHLGPDGQSAYLDPGAPRPVPIRLGRALPLPAWHEPGGRPPFLTAVGPGNVAFASYQPYGAGVFSFHDQAGDLTEGQQVSYLVAGWYSDHAADILAPPRQAAGLAARLAELGWTAQGTESATKTLFHGAISDLIYSRTAVGARPAATAVAVGNSSVDAMTAIIRRQAAAQPNAAINPDLLEAFQYDLLRTLDDIDGPVELNARIHEAWFAAQPGGSTWQVVSLPPPDAAQAALQEKSAGEQDGAPAAAPSWLADLNQAQNTYDTAVRELAALQSRLYEMWWKRGRAKALPPPQRPGGFPDDQYAAQLDPAKPGSLANQVLLKTQQVAAAQATIPWGATQDALAASIHTYTQQHPLPPSTELKRADLPAFRSAADPVVVIAGAHAQSFDDELGVNADGLLPCRFADQTVTGITVTVPPPKPPIIIIANQPGPPPRPPAPPIPLTAAQLGDYLPALDVSALDPAVSLLINEFFLLDPVNAGAVTLAAALATARRPYFPAPANQLIDGVTASMTAGTQMTGTVPAIRPQRWAQPWAPLFLEWEVAYYPIPLNDANWQFDGMDYVCARAGAPGGPIRLSGRSLLAPQPSFTVKSRLDAYLATSPDADLAALESFVTSVDGWDFLSQALSGFNAQLTLHDPASLLAPDAKTVIIPPSTTIASLIGRGALAMPLADGAPAAAAQPVAGKGFQTLRAGQFAFTRLSVVDRFGQSVDLVTAANAAAFAPILGDGLAPQNSFAGPAPTVRYVQLPPRLLQGARLDAQFLPASGAQPPPGGTAAGLAQDPTAFNPVCAWIVPSPLDRALVCYSPDGAMLGQLTATAVGGATTSTRVSWIPAPGSAYTQIGALSQPYPVLANFLIRLAGAGPAAFADLLATIDATLWTIDPPGSGEETHLAALAGRPLALARASVRCELAGPAPLDPTWSATFAPPPPPAPGPTYPVRLGDARLRGDGLVGYLAEPDDGHFRAAYVPTGVTSPYVQPIGPHTFLQPRFNDPAPTNVTLLLDPRAPVHLVSDILPVATLSLPQRFITDALAAMSLTVRFGPVLTDIRQAAGTAAPAIVLPRPPQAHGPWHWAETQALTSAPPSIAVFDITPADAAARFPGTAPTLRSGWLKLTGGLLPPPPR